MNKSKKEGFTLIEMLVVIAMIGLLSAVVLVALGPSRNKAKDTRIISDVNQARSYMEATYDPTAGGYPDYTASFSASSSLASLSLDVTNQNGDTAGKNSGGLYLNEAKSGSVYSAYAFYAKLASDDTKAYCVDSAGNSGTVTASSIGTAAVCP
ncbi:type II secretion system GspH family protein [Patescibacteria group bacterium]|nr:type II secretion system GspH family protein [Patescibacteria group bacterium]MCL5114589.1 type II secretion system GspH family protein [Patescibacteria group bacterium]